MGRAVFVTLLGLHAVAAKELASGGVLKHALQHAQIGHGGVADSPVKQTVLAEGMAEVEAQLTMLAEVADSDSMSPGISDGVNKIDQLLEMMLQSVLQSHADEQAELDKLFKVFDDCTAGFTTHMQSAGVEQAARAQSSSDHKACRTAQGPKAEAVEACRGEELAAKDAMEQDCGIFAGVRAKAEDYTAHQARMEKDSKDVDTEAYLMRISSPFCGQDLTLLEEYNQAEAACDAATAAAKQKTQDCNALDQDFQAKKTECDEYQTTMDGHACEAAVIVATAGRSADDCHAVAVKVYEEAMVAARTNEEMLKLTWRGLQRQKCLSDAFMSGMTHQKYFDCVGKVHSTDNLEITYHAAPPAQEWAYSVDYPYTPEYMKAEFDPIPDDIEVLAPRQDACPHMETTE